MNPLVSGGAGHVTGHRDCVACRPGYPVACTCGGLVHGAGDAGADPDAAPITWCDHCGLAGRPLPPLHLDGCHHFPGDGHCPACPAPLPWLCRCGGWIHTAPSDPAAIVCERCGRAAEPANL